MSATYYLYHFYYKIIIIKQKYLDFIECVNFVQLVYRREHGVTVRYLFNGFSSMFKGKEEGK